MTLLKSLTVAAIATLAALSVPITGSALAQDVAADDIIGVWETGDGQLKFEMFDAGETYSARILYGARLLEADGRTYKKDTRNPDPALQSRSLEGIVFISGLAWNEDDLRWEDGSLYQAASGRTASARVELDAETMNLRAYRGQPMLGRTITLHRVAP
ncbi:conserved hypothetical protein [Hyphomonas neptunium ATCC 15444]|uniref:DUF2147 domain-containing protein n=2 Tax=Hyphomonas TaxID=85 RepID=Q0C049_HYPNA|nr:MULTISPECIES: DUF2147 domain-containing protein [Hyphomonas]ABI77326.1 conserved hypothetical protein [Hyphomonas neptunium ATCC 15444]KCZ90523.1 hypothetical protein HHI_13330 [Hyphomonas hirschiana VP5]